MDGFATISTNIQLSSSNKTKIQLIMEERYRHLVANGYEFDLGKYMSEGWNLFKTGAGSLIGYTLVYLVIAIVSSLIFKGVPIFGEYYDFFSNFINYPLMAGFYIFLYALLNKKDEFSSFFDGFKSFKEIAIFVLFFTLLSLPLYLIFFTSVIPFGMYTEIAGNPEVIESIIEELSYSFASNVGAVSLSSLLFLVGIIYLFISYSLTLPLIVISKLTPWVAMETSRKIVGKKFFQFFGLYFVVGLIMVFGSILTCLLGLLVLFPWSYCVSFTAYNDIIQPMELTTISQIDEFGKSEDDINTESEES